MTDTQGAMSNKGSTGGHTVIILKLTLDVLELLKKSRKKRGLVGFICNFGVYTKYSGVASEEKQIFWFFQFNMKVFFI